MLIIVGGLIVFISMLGGFILAGGNPLVLLHISEFVVIGGMGLGVLIIATPSATLKALIAEVMGSLKGGSDQSGEFLDLLKMLYELFNLARRNGLIAVDEHVSDPKSSSIISKYPSFLNDPQRVEFLVNALRPIIDGKIKPEQLEHILTEEVESMEDEAHQTVDVLTLVGDSLPGIGIVAAVLGIINTMAAIAEGPEAVGQKVAAALTGTFLGIFFAYGFINPMAKRIAFSHQTRFLYFKMINISVSTFAKGMAPIMAIELARRVMEKAMQPSADDLESTLKSLNSSA